MLLSYSSLVLSVCFAMRPIYGAGVEDRLTMDLFRGYNSLVQPVKNISELPMIVRVAMQLVLLINVKWFDYQLRWNPKDYEDITQIRVAPDKIWLPDIVLFNNADGTYEMSFMSNAVIYNTGEILWVPPAIYKSSCIIDVEYFPFDDQQCNLIFGSWTYSKREIKLDHVHSDRVDFSEYSTSSIWDMIDAPAVLTEDGSKVEFQIKIRRKTLFYTVVLILPCVLLAFLNVTVFYLPTSSGEKMGLTMNLLLSIVVFLLLVSKILPATSSSIPLVAKYLLLTFVLNIITILITVIIINVFFRSPKTHRQPQWVRTVFLKFLPIVMCMQRPPRLNDLIKKQIKKEVKIMRRLASIPLGHLPSSREPETETVSLFNEENLNPAARRAIDSIQFITDNMRDEEIIKQCRDDWKFVAQVLDRFLLYAFLGVTLGGTFGILLSAPTVFEWIDEHDQLKRLITLYKRGMLTNDTFY